MTDDAHIWAHLAAVYMSRPEYKAAVEALMAFDEKASAIEKAPHVVAISDCILDALVSVHKEFVKDKLRESAKVLEAYVKEATNPQSLSGGSYWFRMSGKKRNQDTKVYFWENSVQNKGVEQ